ncbi:MAG: UvrD-helicase domain-containing protein, partial [Desulfuromonadales bacterium]|nr:UvrD-helicase domain-containing protein [Desulfuromonadales bacterium]
LLSSLLELLPRLVAELWLVFRAQGQVDFSEIALRAIQALGSVDNPSQLLLDIDQDLKHILVDEFQDTSRLQYRLLDLLTSGWTPGDGRSLFLVGDPMQSIYRFREAEVGLFLHSFLGRFGRQELELTPLVLTANFRSQKGLVDWVNRAFKTVFPTTVDPLGGAVPLSCAEAVRTALAGEACRIYPYIDRQDDLEARQVVDIVKQAYLEDPQQSIAILVRSRNHLNEILPLLRKNQISYQAQDIDLLGAQPAALDIVHLTRALLHRADRLSWLAVLRAPWCGLMLADLHILLTASAGKTIPPVLDRTETVEKMSPDGQQRLGRVWPLLKKAHEERGRLPLRDLVEGCWLSLGAPACYSSATLVDALKVFELLEKLDEGGDLLQFERLDKGLMTLFADAESSADGRLQIMTIHKAKGLEFDTVILPGLGKMPRRQESPLLRWWDHPRLGLLMAPVTEKGHQHKDPLYQWLSALDDEKNDYETGRLLYVATTRAIRRLHLLGHARQDSRGHLKAQNGSLLEKLWPFVADQFSQRGVKGEIPRKDLQVSPQYRLSVGWTRPDLNPLVATLSQVADIPSDKPLRENDLTVFSGWEDPLHRQLGTVVHRQLEKIAKFGVDSWDAHNRSARIEEISRYFNSAGVSSEGLDLMVSKACRALDNCLSSHRGRWILGAHQDHACEWPLTGVIEGRIVRAVIDRTFIVDGVRWVIDYKTSSPLPEETLETFFSREIEHYKKQLAVYVQLLEQADEAVAVRAALYFPLIDGWCEL